MEYRHLRFFLAVADELHFTRAAKRLGVAQPHLSHEIQRLEFELGVELFARTRRRVSLTPAGADFRLRAVEILKATEEAARAARRAARGETGRLVAGYAGSAGYDVFPDTIRRFRAQWPEVELQLVELTTVEQLKALRENRIDVGFLRPWSSTVEPEVEIEIIRLEESLIALPAEHRLAGKRRLSLRDFASESWIVFDRTSGPGLYVQFMHACEAAGFQPHVAQEAGQIPAIINLVATGLGVALVPEPVALLSRPGVEYRRLSPKGPLVPLAVAWRRSAPHPSVLQFLTTVREVGRRK